MIQKIKNLFGLGAQQRSYESQNNLELFLNQFAGSNLNQTQILGAVNSNPVFFSCVNLISNSVASVDYYADDAGVEDMLENPNATHSKHTFLWLVSAYLSTLGTVYVWIRKDKSLATVSPTKIMHAGGLNYQFKHGSQQIKAKLGENLVRLTAPDLQAPFSSGTGLGEVLSQEIDISEAASTHELGYLRNHARPDLLVNYAGMSEKNIKQLKAGWESNFKGSRSSGKVGFSNAEKLKVEQLTSSFKDLGLDKLRAHSADTIREAFGIPKVMLGAKDVADRSGIHGAEYIFAKYVVKPRVNLILDEFNTKILPLLGYKSKIYSEEIVPDDKEFKLKAAKEFPESLTLNEKRAMMDLPAIEGGDNLGTGPVKLKKPGRKRPKLRCSTGVFAEKKHFQELFSELEQL